VGRIYHSLGRDVFKKDGKNGAGGLEVCINV
jgi:hypothetical protein